MQERETTHHERVIRIGQIQTYASGLQRDQQHHRSRPPIWSIRILEGLNGGLTLLQVHRTVEPTVRYRFTDESRLYYVKEGRKLGEHHHSEVGVLVSDSSCDTTSLSE